MGIYKGSKCIAGTGATGATGNKGDKGNAATIAVSSTVTLEPGTSAKVENEGDSYNAKFKFSIPKGAKGDKGDNATITIGTVTKGDTASVKNSGTSTNAVLDIVLPKGDKGDTGNTGVGVSSITSYYLASPNSHGITKDSTGWDSSAQLMTSTNKYLWCYHKFTFTNNTTSLTVPVVIGVYGDKGDPGTTNYNDLSNKPVVNNQVTYTSDVTAKQLRNIYFSTSEPEASDGVNGDIWVVFDNE